MAEGREPNPGWVTWGTCPPPQGNLGRPGGGGLAEGPSWDGGGACLLSERFPGKANPMVLQEVQPALAPLLGPAGRGLRISPSLLFFEQLGSGRWLGAAVATAQDS